MISRRSLLRTTLAASTAGWLQSSKPALWGAENSAAPAVILLFLRGGISQLDSFDPKPDAPVNIRGEFGTIATQTPGVRFSEYLPRLAACSNEFTVIRSICHKVADHGLAMRSVYSGERRTTAETPSLGAVFASQVGWNVPPPYVAIPKIAQDGGQLGNANAAFNLMGDAGWLLRKHSDDSTVSSADRLTELIQNVDGRLAMHLPDNVRLKQRRDAYQHALESLRSLHFRKSLDLNEETRGTQDRFGRTDLGRYLLLARRIVEAGSRFVTVEHSHWDFHTDNFRSMRPLLPQLDQALSSLLLDLRERGMLSQTSIVVATDFGRTPQVNAGAGRGHWPGAMSMLWAGGRVHGGNVIGQTDSNGAAPISDPVSLEQFGYSLLESIGLQPETIRLPDGRRILATGHRIQGLWT